MFRGSNGSTILLVVQDFAGPSLVSYRVLGSHDLGSLGRGRDIALAAISQAWALQFGVGTGWNRGTEPYPFPMCCKVEIIGEIPGFLHEKTAFFQDIYIYITHVQSPAFSHVFPMIFTCCFPWFSYYCLMIFSWFSNDFHMMFQWFSHDVPMIFTWSSHDFHMIFPSFLVSSAAGFRQRRRQVSGLWRLALQCCDFSSQRQFCLAMAACGASLQETKTAWWFGTCG